MTLFLTADPSLTLCLPLVLPLCSPIRNGPDLRQQVTWSELGLGVAGDALAQSRVQAGPPQWLAGWWAAAPGCHGLPGEALPGEWQASSLGPDAPRPLASLPHIYPGLWLYLVKFSKDGTELGVQDCQLEG